MGRGSWVASPFGTPSLVVAGRKVVSDAPGTDRAAALNLASLDLGRPWSFGLTLEFHGPAPGPGADSYSYLQIGDEGGPQNSVAVEVNDSSGGSDHALIYLADDVHQIGAVVPFAFGVRHAVTMTWDGATHRAFLDGVEIVSGPLRNPGTIVLKMTSAVISGDAAALDWGIQRVEFSARALPT